MNFLASIKSAIDRYCRLGHGRGENVVRVDIHALRELVHHYERLDAEVRGKPVENEPSTPAAQWRQKGESDPHQSSYECERARLTLGHLTDDELANAAYLGYNQPLDIAAILSNDPDYHSPIALMTAAKERIRWLSRALVRAEEARALDHDIDLEPYDAGHLNDHGGGNVGWWQDYIRAELDRAHDHYQSQIGCCEEVNAP